MLEKDREPGWIERYCEAEGLNETPVERASAWLTDDDPDEIRQHDYRHIKEGHHSDITGEELRAKQRAGRIVRVTSPILGLEG